MEQEDSAIKKKEKKLFSQEYGDLEARRGHLSNVKHESKESWGTDYNIEQMTRNNKKFPTLLSLLFFSIVFFVGAIGFAFYLGMEGTNTVSPDNVDILISGPVSVKAGEDFNLPIVITNKNNLALEYVDLIVTFPGGSKIYTNKSNESQYRKNLGTIKSNEAVSETVKTALFGEANSEKQIVVKIQYRNEKSNAIIEKSTIFKTVISSSPLSLYFDAPTDTNSNQEITLNAKVISNSKETLNKVMLSLSYPPGFIFKSATPAPLLGDSTWDIGDLKQGEEKLIKISGVIQGQTDEEKTFRVSAGVRTNVDSNKVDILYASALKTVAIKKPFINLGLTLNGSSDDILVINDGNSIKGDIQWLNNLPVALLHGELSVKITGDVVNKSSINSMNGFYKSVDNTIVWNNSSGGLPASIESGKGSKATFSFGTLSLLSGKRSIFKNPEINLEIRFKGVRFADAREDAGTVETTIYKKIRLASNLQVSPRALYYSGAFKNTGPLPPVHDEETTYTVAWSIINSSNDVSDVSVRASLPPNVKWIGTISPPSEKVAYNPLGDEIIWNVGYVKAGEGVTIPAKEVSFQVAIVPGLAQVGSYPDLISDTFISGKDIFTNTDISYSRRALNTQLNSDPLVTGEASTAVR